MGVAIFRIKRDDLIVVGDGAVEVTLRLISVAEVRAEVADVGFAPHGSDHALPAPDVGPAVCDVVITRDEEDVSLDPAELLGGESEFILGIGAVYRHVAAADNQIARLAAAGTIVINGWLKLSCS